MTLSLKLFLLGLFIASPGQAQLMSTYTLKVGRLNNLEKKVEEQKLEIKGLLKAVQANKDEVRKKELFEEMTTAHKSLKETIKDYNKVRLELKYEYPKKNDLTVRRYLPLREQTIDEIENETGIDSVLTRVKQKIDTKYRNFTLETKETVEFESTKSKSKLDPEKDKLVLEK